MFSTPRSGMARGHAVRRRIQQRAKLTNRALRRIVARRSPVVAAAIGITMIGVHQACAAGVLLAKERPSLAGFGAGAIRQAAISIRAGTDSAASIERAVTRRTSGSAAGVVLGANVATGTVEIVTTGIRPRMARLVLATLSTIWTFGALAALPLRGAVAVPIDAALFICRATGVVLRAVLARSRAAQLFPIAPADAAATVTAHRGGVVAAFRAAFCASARATQCRRRGRGSRRGWNRCRRLRNLGRNRSRRRRSRESAPRRVRAPQPKAAGNRRGAHGHERLQSRAAIRVGREPFHQCIESAIVHSSHPARTESDPGTSSPNCQIVPPASSLPAGCDSLAWAGPRSRRRVIPSSPGTLHSQSCPPARSARTQSAQ
jgi:hypothetical protein